MKKRTSIIFVLGALAILASVISVFDVLTCVVPWLEYQHLQSLIVCFSVTAVLSLAWAWVAFKRRRFVVRTIASVWAVLALVAALFSANDLRDYKLVPSTKFDGRDMLGAYRSARQALDTSGHGDLFIYRISSVGWWNGGLQGYFRAAGTNGVIYGSTGGDGVWTLRRDLQAGDAIKPLNNLEHDIAEVLQEVGTRCPDMTNGLHNVSRCFSGGKDCRRWHGEAFSKGSWSLSDDFREFKVWDKNGKVVK